MGFFNCNSTYYCRICELPRDECGRTTEDDLATYRTKESYAIALDRIETSRKVEPKETLGIARYCVLNNLKYFHIYDNFNVDIMHDVCEGVIPFLHQKFFNYCIDKRILSEDDLKNYIFYHDHGVLNARNIPSAICISRHNLGQNASQQKCLIHNVPYILYEFKNDPKLTNVWPCVEYMLKILRIIYSTNIKESDLLQLEEIISSYLKSIIENFDVVNLTYKHHMMVHYPNIIRAVGPLVHMSTMRFEMQHKSFTNYARRSNNYINVTKSLAMNHQKAVLLNEPYQTKISHAKLRGIQNCSIECYNNILTDSRAFETHENISVTKWLKINNNYYRKGLMLKGNNSSFYEIVEVLFQSGIFYFECQEYELMEFDSFLYSREIRKRIPIKYHVINEKMLHIKKSFMKKIVDSKTFIVADCLEIPVE